MKEKITAAGRRYSLLEKGAISRTLTRARALLAPEGVWMQGEGSEGAHGVPCEPTDHRARRWCLTAALERAAFETGGDPRLDAAHAGGELRFHLPGIEDCASWNDAPGRTHEDVLQLLDRAIAA